MKTKKWIFAITTLALLPLLLQSCNKDDNYYYYGYGPNGLVTVKNLDDTKFYLQIEDNVTLRPVNILKNPYGKDEVRALITYKETNDDPEEFTKAAYIYYMKKILTKQPVETTDGEDDKVYGNDPVEIMNSWATILEDNYLTLHFGTVWGDTDTPHIVNLVTGTNPDNPYEVVFRHNAKGDTSGVRATSLVAFSLKDLPDTKGKTVKLTLKWNSFSGDKRIDFDYCTSKDLTPKKSTTNIDSDFKDIE